MNSPLLQLMVLAGIAVFLILRLKNVLGTRDGYEPTQPSAPVRSTSRGPNLEVIEGGPDRDITDHVEEGSDAAEALSAMKRVDTSFNVSGFLQGARGAYEMILMGFENGDMAKIKPFLSAEVYEAFAGVVESRAKQGLTVEAEFVGMREMALAGAAFNGKTGAGELTIKYVGEITSVVRDNSGEIVEGEEGKVKRQKDVWTFERIMDSNDPNWQLVATSG